MTAEAVAAAIKEEREAVAKSYEDTVVYDRRVAAAYHAGATSHQPSDDYDRVQEEPLTRRTVWQAPTATVAATRFDRETGRFVRG